MDLCKSLVKSVFLALLMCAAPIISAQNHHNDSTLSGDFHKLNPESTDVVEEVDYFGEFVFHHISDDYSFHVVGETHIPLPMIIFEPGKGVDCFMSSALHHPDHATGLIRGKYIYEHGHLVIAELDANGLPVHDEHGHIVGKHEAKISDLFGGGHSFYNFSITKNVFAILLACTLLVVIFVSVARAYKRNPNKAPRGLQGAMEPLILYVKDEVVKPSIGKKYAKFLPYLLTLFFFIWINNLIGLIPIFPGSANVTGNIAVTFTLAFMALVLQVINANRHFWGHIFWFPGVPVPVKILLAVIEFIGLFTKPFSLMIRLFANITAGHIIIMSIIGISFVMKNVYLGIATSIFSVAMFTLELLVAAIQAYIFTLLTALMIGSAVEEGHHHEHEHEAAHH